MRPVPGDANGRWCRLSPSTDTEDVRLIIANRSWGGIIVALAAGLAAHGATTHVLKPLIDVVIRNGPDSRLPAHLSVIMGVSQVEETTAVKQAVVRDGATVRTFNVCVANPDDVVMIHYNEQSRLSKAYLSSSTGTLRKALSFRAGEPATVRTLPAARDDFAKEMNFWVDFGKSHSAPH